MLPFAILVSGCLWSLKSHFACFFFFKVINNFPKHGGLFKTFLVEFDYLQMLLDKPISSFTERLCRYRVWVDSGILLSEDKKPRKEMINVFWGFWAPQITKMWPSSFSGILKCFRGCWGLQIWRPILKKETWPPHLTQSFRFCFVFVQRCFYTHTHIPTPERKHQNTKGGDLDPNPEQTEQHIVWNPRQGPKPQSLSKGPTTKAVHPN